MVRRSRDPQQELSGPWKPESGVSAQQSLILSRTIRLRPRSEMKVEPSVITVPGYHTPSPSSWGVADELQEAAIPVDSVSQLHIYSYAPSINPDAFTWEEFMKTGSDLAEDLAQLATEVLYSCARIAVQKQLSRLPRRDVYQLAHLAATFEQIATIPVLSVFEHTEAPSGFNKFFGKRTKALVDEQFATISSEAERLLGVHLSHSELCKLPMLRNQTYSARDFLRSLFTDMAKSRRWSTSTGLTSAPSIPASNPLNPLNLAPIDPVESSGTSIFSSSSRPRSVKMFTRPSFEALPSQTAIMDTNIRRLLETRKCHLPCFNLSHTPNPDFVGRKDILETMDRYLLPSVSDSKGLHNTRLFALCGMGGIGKTDVAIQYAHSRRSKFGAVFWLDSGGISQLTVDFAQIASQLGLLSSTEAGDLESSIKIAKAWLTSSMSTDSDENETWLLIFDNADDLDIIADYVPCTGNGSVLITSRDPFAKENFFSHGTGIDMSPLSMDDSATLLRKLTRKTEDTSTLDERAASVTLATKLDGLPLAMTQMAGFIRRRRVSIREFISLYDTDARYAEIHDFSNYIQSHRYGYTLATAYNFQDLSPHATKLLQLLAFMNPDRIQESIFVDSKAAKSDVKSAFWTPSTFESARFELLTSSIVKRNIDKKELWIHRVIQAEVRTRIDEARGYQVFKDAVELLNGVWPPGDLLMQAKTRWAACEDLMPHLEQFYNLYLEYASVWDDFEVDITFPSLLNEMGVKANITQEPLLSNMHLTMGALCNGLHDAQASLEHNILCLTIRKDEAAKRNQPDLPLAFAHSQMGISYMGVKKYALATEYFKQSVELLKTIDADYDQWCFPVCNLGLAYWIQGELDQANTLLTEYWTRRQTFFGRIESISYKNARVLHALGNVRASLATQAERRGELDAAKKLWEEAFGLHKDCFNQYHSSYGTFNRRVGDASHKLAEHYIRLSEDAKAKELLERSLSIWGDWPWFKNELARSAFLHGTHLRDAGDEEDAEAGRYWIEKAMKLRSQILPGEKPKDLEQADFDDLVCFWSI
ncbi:uncharacterized protein E0L32_011349 [Thyridium curvatum]|uniref:DUF7779 domain-containing protein n=1 Tax=Thyridium curvatum TaxID=1093900 RepID=A0A507BHS6_9PEZI|nr:uncharacterized protein E0L32_011349 [Thyridium curvatum]TPX18956.1 hypothetical protein E0L32_011349 [Thyridium curvatum]